MAKYVMVIDAAKCTNCKACLMACQQENRVPYHSFRNWIKEGADDVFPGRHFQPGNCMQCDTPVCVEACPTGATGKSPKDGVVYVNTGLCIGCGACVAACPYGARFRNPVLGVAEKCDYCPRLRSQGLAPACVSVCPTRTRRFGDLEDPASGLKALVDGGNVIRLRAPATDTSPSVYYLGHTAPLNWPRDARAPLPIGLWKVCLTPLARIAGVLALLGVAWASARQAAARGADGGGQGG